MKIWKSLDGDREKMQNRQEIHELTVVFCV